MRRGRRLHFKAAAWLKAVTEWIEADPKLTRVEKDDFRALAKILAQSADADGWVTLPPGWPDGGEG